VIRLTDDGKDDKSPGILVSGVILIDEGQGEANSDSKKDSGEAAWIFDPLLFVEGQGDEEEFDSGSGMMPFVFANGLLLRK